MTRYPACVLCGEAVTCGQQDGLGRPTHYGYLGICQLCYRVPAAGAYDYPDRCAGGQDADEDESSVDELPDFTDDDAEEGDEFNPDQVRRHVQTLFAQGRRAVNYKTSPAPCRRGEETDRP